MTLPLQHTEQVTTHRDRIPVGCDLLGALRWGVLPIDTPRRLT